MDMTYDQMKQIFLHILPQYIGYGNMLSQADLDQGDTLQRMGTLYALLALINDEELTTKVNALMGPIERLQEAPGYYRRSPDPNFWGYDARCTSRDQLSIIKVGMAACNMNYLLMEVFKAQAKRLGFHQNYYDVLETRYHIPDPAIPFEISVYLRAFLGKASTYLTWFFDLGLVADYLLRDASDLNKWSQDNMLSVSLLYANHVHPNFVTKRLMTAYLRTDFMERLWNYHRATSDNNGCEPLYWLYRMAFLRLENYTVA